MPRVDVRITTRDGACPASVFTPSTGAAPWPGAIFFMDGFGIRPAMRDMAQRLADGGYLVLLPDLYYRFGEYLPKTPSKILADPELRNELLRSVKSLDRGRKVSDAAAFIDLLSSMPQVKKDRFGATGYCMGGNAALTAAGAFPDRFAAIASFHGGHLATDEPDSPHLFVGGITGRVYVAGAVDDPFFTQDDHDRLEQALTAARIDHLIEIYPGARHGFAVPDQPVFDDIAAERHWSALFELFRRAFAAAL
jgi:carboxymethylenebutenolidase